MMNVEDFKLKVKILGEHSDWRPFSFYSPNNPDKVIYPHELEGIRRRLITVNDVPVIGLDGQLRAIQFTYASTKIASTKLAVALLEQPGINAGKDWSEKLQAEFEKAKAPKKPAKKDVKDDDSF